MVRGISLINCVPAITQKLMKRISSASQKEIRNCVALKIYVPTTKIKVAIKGHRFVTYNSCVSHNSQTD